MPAKDNPANKEELEKEKKVDQENESQATQEKKDISEKPKYKVEEKKSESKEEKPTTLEKTEDNLSSQPRKITSFSQLDTNSAAVSKNESATVEQEREEEKPLSLETPKKDETPHDEQENFSEDKQVEKKEMSSEEIKEWLSEVRPEKESVKEKKGFPLKVIIWIIVVLAILGALVGGIIYYKSSFSEKSDLATQPDEETTTPTATPEPTEETESESEEVSLEDYKVRVLNGSGIAGEAGEVADLLVNAGFTSPDTGNAGSYDFTTTVVELKENIPDSVYNSIKEALSDDYVVEKSEEKLEDTSSYDIVVTVGTQ